MNRGAGPTSILCFEHSPRSVMHDTVELTSTVVCHIKAVKAEAVILYTFCTKRHLMQLNSLDIRVKVHRYL